MQTMVLIAIFTDLLIKRKATRTALAEKYELSPRTISRYITVLAGAGVPIESRAGLSGGYYLDESYRLDRLLFHQDEYNRIADALLATADQYCDGLNEKIIEKIKPL